MYIIKWLRLLPVVVLSVFAAPCFGLVTGTITDTTGKTVSGASITFTDESNSLNSISTTTDESGDYQITIVTSIDDAYDATTVPKPFSLEQNYPNPFNPSTTIPFRLVQASLLKINIYNIQGQKIRTLCDGHFTSGQHYVTWNGADDHGKSVSAGVYFYQLRVGNGTKTMKMLLLDGGNSLSAKPALNYSAKSIAKSTALSTYTVTITHNKIVPFEKKGVTITDGQKMDFVVSLIDSSGGNTTPADTTTVNGAYSLSNGGTVELKNGTYASTTKDESTIKVTNGTLTLTNCTITKSGDTSNTDNSSFYGQNAAVLSSGSSSSITMTGGKITTSAKGANATVAYGGTIVLTNIAINCSGGNARGIHATGGGKITATNVTATTSGDNSSVIATDRGGGTVNVIGGTYTVSGKDTAVLYSTGAITANGITGTSLNGEAAVIEGTNSVTITNCNLTTGGSTRGMLILQSGSGDAKGVIGTLSMTGGSLTATNASAPLVEVVTNSTGNITFNDVALTIASGILMKVDYNSRWSTSGAVGNMILSGSTAVKGDIVADNTGTATITVNAGTVWTGAFDNANTAKSGTVTLNGGTWSLTANSNVDTLNLTNNATINKNGYTLTVTTVNNTSGTIND